MRSPYAVIVSTNGHSLYKTHVEHKKYLESDVQNLITHHRCTELLAQKQDGSLILFVVSKDGKGFFSQPVDFHWLGASFGDPSLSE
jgi:hypothetical protein